MFTIAPFRYGKAERLGTSTLKSKTRKCKTQNNLHFLIKG